MLTQKFNRTVAARPRITSATDYTNCTNIAQFYSCDLRNSWQKILLALFLCVSAANLSCSSKPADLRALMPADSLVYLESNDLGAVMKAITERPAFREAAKSIPDFSALNGVKLAVSVTGFETKEEAVTDANSVLKFTPHFVAAIETNAWNFQANSFTENQLGEFINQVYGGDVLLETSPKNDGKYFVWTAKDGRKAFALVQGSVIYFANDESSIDKCLAVQRGEAEPIAKNPKITGGDRLAFGYVSPDGVAQLASIIGVKYALEAGDVPESKSAIAGILPQLLRNLITDVSWTATRTEQGIEDSWSIAMPPDIAGVLAETMSPNSEPDWSLLDNLNEFVPSVTIYNLKDPNIAWRSLLLVAQEKSDPVVSRIIPLVAESVFEPYGIKDAEEFFGSVGTTLVTAGEPDSSDDRILVASIRDEAKLRKSLTATLRRTEIIFGNRRKEIWKAENEGLAAEIKKGSIMIGATEMVLKTLNGNGDPGGKPNEFAATRSREFQNRIAAGARSSSITKTIDRETVMRLANVLAPSKTTEEKIISTTFVENSFNRNGLNRLTVSDFGFIGWIITQFGSED